MQTIDWPAIRISPKAASFQAAIVLSQNTLLSASFYGFSNLYIGQYDLIYGKLHNFETSLQPTLMQGRSFLKVQLYFEIGSSKMQLLGRCCLSHPCPGSMKIVSNDNMISIDNVGGKWSWHWKGKGNIYYYTYFVCRWYTKVGFPLFLIKHAF